MFYRKKIKRLNATIDSLKRDIRELEDDKIKLKDVCNNYYDKMMELQQEFCEKPIDCKMSIYCKSCAFGEQIEISAPYKSFPDVRPYTLSSKKDLVLTVCKKNKRCEHFIPKICNKK